MTIRSIQKNNDTDAWFFDVLASLNRNDIETALKSGAKANACDNTGHSPMTWVVKNIDELDVFHAIVRILLSHGAHVDEPDKKGDTPLLVAVKSRRFMPATALVSTYGASMSMHGSDGTTPFIEAVRMNFIEMVKSFLNKSLLPDIEDRYGTTMLLAAAMENNHELMRMLVQRGSNPNKTDRFGKTPLMRLLSWKNKDVTRSIQVLISLGVNVNMYDEDGNTALMFAVVNSGDDCRVVKLLMDAGAEIDIANKSGITPLMAAKQLELPGVSGLLEAYGAIPRVLAKNDLPGILLDIPKKKKKKKQSVRYV